MEDSSRIFWKSYKKNQSLSGIIRDLKIRNLLGDKTESEEIGTKWKKMSAAREWKAIQCFESCPTCYHRGSHYFKCAGLTDKELENDDCDDLRPRKRATKISFSNIE